MSRNPPAEQVEHVEKLVSSEQAIAEDERESEAPEISILLHISDSDARVELLIQAYERALDSNRRSGELIFILDGPHGRVLESLERAQARDARIKILALQGGGNGESIAYTAALEHARGRYLITVGDYLQIDPKELSLHLATLEAGSDLVCSWRSPRVDPILNRLQSRFFNWFLRRVAKMPLHDLNCGFRSMRREVLEEISVYGDQFRFLPIMAVRRGFTVSEVKVKHLEERGKTGFFGLGVYLRRLLDIVAVTFLTRFTQKPLRFFGIIGVFLILLGTLLALPPIYQRIFHEATLLNRPIVLMGVVLITFGFQCIGFGLVGEIIIFTRAKSLKDYKVERVVGKYAQESNLKLVPAITVEEIATIKNLFGEHDPRRVFVRHAAPGEHVVFDRYVLAHEDGEIFHLHCWRSMVEEVFKKSGMVLVAERSGKIVGILPYFHIRSIILGRIAVSMPFGVYGGCLADDDEAAKALIATACRESDAEGNRYLELRHKKRWDLPLTTRDLYVTYVTDLPEDPADCLAMIPRKARAECRKGRDMGQLVFEQGVDLKLFYRLFAVNKQALGSPTISLAHLRSIVDKLETEGRVVMHRVSLPGGKCIAAVMSFLIKDRIQPYYSGALKGYEHLGVNNFMYWKLMEWASAKGIAQFDFGRSRVGSGAAKFKKNMGLDATPLYYQYHLCSGSKLPDFHPSNPRLNILRMLWRWVPGPIARFFGGRIFKHLA